MTFRSEVNGQIEGFKPPRLDVNSPDMYIPVMSFVTYIVLIGTIMGLEKRFKPEVLTMAASTAMFFTLIEVLFLRLGIYLLGVGSGNNANGVSQQQESGVSLTDLVAYAGYKFVSVIAIQVLGYLLNAGGWLKFLIFCYCSLTLGWFMVSTMSFYNHHIMT